ncbi:hypothetical protein [Pedobacter duraquae]|uniref:Uncharacterized protein n=1 Tax=Pedobacter duraquae TaxID=425511 RepID=A0A4R6IH03_9SPHI|nr:hypothetical protein [Pedobacter duraquae]TDO21414.1 hypothetical protein CLV32_2519 [Pedobacter duraquae]
MAKFDGKHLRGLLGPFIFKKTKKGSVVSTKAEKVRQTEETKKSASFFGGVASFARVLRTMMKPVGVQDTGLMNRLNKELLSVLLQCYNKPTKTFNFTNTHFKRLEGMDLNSNSLLKENLWDLPGYSKNEDQLIISVPNITPGKNLSFPNDALFCELYIQPIQIDLNGGYFKKMDAIRIEISFFDEVVSAQEFNVELFPGTLCIVAVGLNYFKKNVDRYIDLNNLDFSPAAFAYAAMHDGVFAEVVHERVTTELEEGSSVTNTVFWSKEHQGFPIQQLPVQ